MNECEMAVLTVDMGCDISYRIGGKFLALYKNEFLVTL